MWESRRLTTLLALHGILQGWFYIFTHFPKIMGIHWLEQLAASEKGRIIEKKIA
jgi:hypothetical protein